MSTVSATEESSRPSTATTFTAYPLREQTGQPLRLVSHEDAPAFLKRSYILSGYLVGGVPSAAAVSTLFRLNNETMNAWTMILGILVALAGLATAWARVPDQLTPMVIMAVSALPHLPASVRLHLTIGVSEQVRDFWRTMDVFLIFTCAVPRAAALGWYVFSTRRSYGAFLVVAALVYLYCINSTMVRRRIKDIPKHVLAKDVTVTVLCYTFPLLVEAAREIQGSVPGPALLLYSSIFTLLVLASSAYSAKWPERWAPGWFDLIGNSHQVMHVSVVIEYYLEWVFMFHMSQRHQQQLSTGSPTASPVDQLSRLLTHLASPSPRY